MKRYSAVACFSSDLQRVVLIHKLRPGWQAGKANFPGGKVEDGDYDSCWQGEQCLYTAAQSLSIAHAVCARRELREETGLSVAAADLKLFCRLRFNKPVAGEVWFYCCVADVDAAKTVEEEQVFCSDIEWILTRGIALHIRESASDFCTVRSDIPTMSNLPFLTAMARQTLLGSKAPPFTVIEDGSEDETLPLRKQA